MEIFYRTRWSLKFVGFPKDQQYAHCSSYLPHTVVFFTIIVSIVIPLFAYLLIKAEDVREVSQCIYMLLGVIPPLFLLLILLLQRTQILKFIDLVECIINKRKLYLNSPYNNAGPKNVE